MDRPLWQILLPLPIVGVAMQRAAIGFVTLSSPVVQSTDGLALALLLAAVSLFESLRTRAARPSRRDEHRDRGRALRRRARDRAAQRVEC